MEKIAIVVLHFNKVKETLSCITSLQKLSVKNFTLSIIVVDNGSTEKFQLSATGSGLKKIQVEIIRNESNRGFSGGNNAGIRHALQSGCEYIIVLNNDTIVDENLVSKLYTAMQKNEKIGITSPKIYFAKGYEFHKERYKKEDLGKVLWYAGGIIDWANVIARHRGVDEVDVMQYNSVEKTDFASGCCMMIRSTLLKQVGLFDEKYFLYYEDNDFSQRAKRKGFSLMYVPQAFLWHKNASSAGGSGSSLQDYYITRNRMIFGFCYASLRAKVALVKESIVLLFRGRKWQRIAAMDFYLGKLGKGTYNDF